MHVVAGRADPWSQGHYGSKSQVEAPRIPHLSQDSNPRAILHPLGGIAVISAAISLMAGKKRGSDLIPVHLAVHCVVCAEGSGS